MHSIEKKGAEAGLYSMARKARWPETEPTLDLGRSFARRGTTAVFIRFYASPIVYSGWQKLFASRETSRSAALSWF